MTVNEAYLDAPGANVTLDYILEMTPRHHDTFPSTPYTFPGHICPFPGLLFVEMLIFNPRSGGNISKSRKLANMPRKPIRSVRRSRKPVWGSRKRIYRYKEGLH